MDERELRTFYQATQPILQRTAPPEGQSPVTITPRVIEQIGWGVVLAYVANVSPRPPREIPPQARSGEGPLPDEMVQAALGGLRRPHVHPKLAPNGRATARFVGAACRLLEANGWTPPRAAQAAGELADALGAATSQR